MQLHEWLTDLDYLTQRASQLAGEQVRLFELDCELEAVLLRKARRVATAGLGSEPDIREFGPDRCGNTVSSGLVRFLVNVEGNSVPLIRVVNPFSNGYCNPFNGLWAVPARFYRLLYRSIRRGVRSRRSRALPPIMPAAELQRLWENTVGFLLRGEEALNRFGVVLKRGLLLTGEPGNGKTLAARWLQSKAIEHGLEWRTVTAEDYEMARRDGEGRATFRLEHPGVILFDDFDAPLRQRDAAGSPVDSSTFLCEMDGVDARSGVVYLFTSNASLDRLDPAFRRPGRIDCVFRFDRPDAELRRRLIHERWPKEIVAELPVAEAVAATDGRSFAELEELRKLLVLDFLETGRWDWSRAWNRLREREHGSSLSRPLGFTAAPERGAHRRFASPCAGSAEQPKD